MKERNQTADLLKGVAVLLMIQVHLLELFASEKLSNTFFGDILLFLGGPPVAPLFMVLFGYYIADSQKSIKQLVARGLTIFMLGMLLNIALNFNLILHVYRGDLSIELAPYIFGVDIFQFAGIALLILAGVKNVFQNNNIALFLCLILSLTIASFLPNITIGHGISHYFYAYFFGCTSWSYFPLFPWLAYPLSGMLFYKLQPYLNLNLLHSWRRKFIPLLLIVCFFTITLPYAINIASNLQMYYHHDFIFAFWVVSFLLFYCYIMRVINSFAGNYTLLRYIKWLGENVTIIYITQWILIGNLATEIYKTVTSPLVLISYFVVVLGISSLTTYLFLKAREKYNTKFTSS